jgi:purine-nucleoside/S-methyl-5'-thioadenosine phosphorylase / adenosine deaminase
LNKEYRVPGTESRAAEPDNAVPGTRYPVLSEEPLAGPVPRFEIPGWRERYGIVAGITGRGDGEDPGFDLGLWTREPVGQVMSRWRALREAEPRFHGTVLGTQVHGSTVRRHAGTTGWLQVDGVDGHLTSEPGLMLAVTVADCIPVYLIDPARRHIALLHAGWRGTAGGILGKGVEALEAAGTSHLADVVMHCGVGICGECYEVGSEVMDGCHLPRIGTGPWHADLRAVLRDQALRLGITSISTSQWCSGHDRAWFYSHRASGGTDGRMVAYLGMLP